MSKERQHYNCIPGYDMVARIEAKRNREKIKELEEKVGSGGSTAVENVLYEAHGVSVEPDDDGRYVIDLSGYVPLVVGRSYFINFNGSAFIRKAAYLEPLYPTNGIYIGNPHIAFEGNEDTGENFYIFSNEGRTFLVSKDSISDVKISTSGTVVGFETDNLQMQYKESRGLWEAIVSRNGFMFQIGHTYLVEIDGIQNKTSGRYHINGDGTGEMRYVGNAYLEGGFYGTDCESTFEDFIIYSADYDQFIIRTMQEVHSIKISEVLEEFNPVSVVWDVAPTGQPICNLSYHEAWDLLHQKVVPVFLNQYAEMGDDLRMNQYVPASLVMIPDFIAMGMQFIFPGSDGNNITIGYLPDGSVMW